MFLFMFPLKLVSRSSVSLFCIAIIVTISVESISFSSFIVSFSFILNMFVYMRSSFMQVSFYLFKTGLTFGEHSVDFMINRI